MHNFAICKKVYESARFHTKSWSHEHVCPICGKSRRYNTNFLGNKYEAVCNGEKIIRQMRQVWVDRLAARV